MRTFPSFRIHARDYNFEGAFLVQSITLSMDFIFFVLALSLDPFAHAYCVLCEIILITYLHVNQNALKLLCIHVRRAANKMFFVGFSVLV